MSFCLTSIADGNIGQGSQRAEGEVRVLIKMRKAGWSFALVTSIGLIIAVVSTGSSGGATPLRSVPVSDLQNLGTSWKDFAPKLTALNQRYQAYRNTTRQVAALNSKLRLQVEEVSKRAQIAKNTGTVDARVQLYDAIKVLRDSSDETANNEKASDGFWGAEAAVEAAIAAVVAAEQGVGQGIAAILQAVCRENPAAAGCFDFHDIRYIPRR